MIPAVQQDGDAAVWPAFVDVLMIVCFVLILYLFTQAAVAGQASAELVVVRTRQEALRKAVEQAVPAPLRADIRISEDGNLQRFTFADRVLFDSARAALKPSGMEALRVVGQVLSRHSGDVSRIQIEGHTDDRPLQAGAGFPSNWELSSARATSVVRFLQDQAGIDPRLLSATGHSEYHPVAPGDPSDAAAARNRRIEVVVVYSFHGAARPAAGEGGR